MIIVLYEMVVFYIVENWILSKCWGIDINIEDVRVK